MKRVLLVSTFALSSMLCAFAGSNRPSAPSATDQLMEATAMPTVPAQSPVTLQSAPAKAAPAKRQNIDSSILSISVPQNSTEIAIKYAVTIDPTVVASVRVGIIASDDIEELTPDDIEAAATMLKEYNTLMWNYHSASGEGRFMPLKTGRYTLVAVAFDTDDTELCSMASLTRYEADGPWDLLTPLSLNDDLYQCQRISTNVHNDFGYPSLMMWLDTQTADMVSEKNGYNWFSSAADFRDVCNPGSTYSLYPWKYPYANIKVANTILHRVGSETSEDADEMFVIAQARAYRAFDYWVLAQLFQRNYVGHKSAPCVPLITSANMFSAAESGAPRDSVQAVYDRILDDLNVAIDYLSRCGHTPQSVAGDDGRRLVSLATAYGLRARVYMTMHAYAEAAADADMAIRLFDGAPASAAEVARPTFKEMNERNWMWGIHPAANSRAVSSGIVNWPSHICSLYSHSYASLVPRKINRALFDRIPSTDVRRGWWLDKNGRSENLAPDWQNSIDTYFDSNAPYANVKFAPHQDDRYGEKAGDVPMMRIEEMYLVRAEATAMTGDVVGGAALLRKFVREYRDHAYELPDYSSASDIQRLVWMQRRVEMWGEGLAWFDLMRLGKGVDRRGGGWEEAWCFNIPADDPLMLFPIPTTEIWSNPLISDDDNNPAPSAPENVADYPYISATFQSLCGSSNRLSFKLESSTTPYQIWGAAFGGVIDDIDDLIQAILKNGQVLSTGASYSMQMGDYAGPASIFCVAVDAEGNVIAIAGDVAYCFADDDDEWVTLGNGSYSFRLNNFSTTTECEIQEHMTAKGYYRVMQAGFDNTSHAGHSHHLYIHAERPEYVYIEPFYTGLTTSGDVALSSRVERFMSAGADPAKVRASFPELFGTRTAKEITIKGVEGEPSPLSMATYGYNYSFPSWHQGDSYITVTLPSASALTGVAADPAPEAQSVEYYNLQGIRVTNPVSGQIYVVRRADGSTAKILK
ncbi:MAG: RagB/SusD family nutrient uptake outer membrane protein [Candidatus Amulumruptor caecigallinarius]|nr:RagB/SusD family nutrient uptake outer membrane protein [Candidatus Amulumruptor caecigallinarius]MCM1395872.1 RagB/SusD family nutrient uptake outer membrane protein [Candidatus Amulumruptor caecigallinarius]MCM1452907.1 RagB/SusD family nutrient uptake outer membrane protein [bacterium]